MPAARSSPIPLPLVPWAAFLVTTVVVDPRTYLVGVIVAAPFYLPFVALPSWLPFAVAHHRSTYLAAVAIMTATAIVAGFTMATSDDAQAGLAVLLVPYVAVPLAGLIWVGGAVARRLRR